MHSCKKKKGICVWWYNLFSFQIYNYLYFLITHLELRKVNGFVLPEEHFFYCCNPWTLFFFLWNYQAAYYVYISILAMLITNHCFSCCWAVLRRVKGVLAYTVLPVRELKRQAGMWQNQDSLVVQKDIPYHIT